MMMMIMREREKKNKAQLPTINIVSAFKKRTLITGNFNQRFSGNIIYHCNHNLTANEGDENKIKLLFFCFLFLLFLNINNRVIIRAYMFSSSWVKMDSHHINCLLILDQTGKEEKQLTQN